MQIFKSTEVVNRSLEPHLAIGLNNIFYVIGVGHLFVFGELEDEPVRREARLSCGLEGQLYTSCGRINGVRQKVDGQTSAGFKDASFNCAFDRRHATLLIE